MYKLYIYMLILPYIYIYIIYIYTTHAKIQHTMLDMI